MEAQLAAPEERATHRQAGHRLAWHRAGFRWYWRLRSRRRCGKPRIADEIRNPIRHFAEENDGWGAPKIHGELQKLGLTVSERTVARYLRPHASPRRPACPRGSPAIMRMNANTCSSLAGRLSARSISRSVSEARYWSRRSAGKVQRRNIACRAAIPEMERAKT